MGGVYISGLLPWSLEVKANDKLSTDKTEEHGVFSPRLVCSEILGELTRQSVSTRLITIFRRPNPSAHFG